MSKKALIIGVSSQDGSYLAEFLLEKGYDVVGTVRHTTNFLQENIQHLYGKIKIVAADLIDSESLSVAVRKSAPQEIYNIAAQSVPSDSWDQPFYTGEVTARMAADSASFVILGHSERRKYFKETAQQTAQKAVQALDNNIIPVVSVDRENFQEVLGQKLLDILSNT